MLVHPLSRADSRGVKSVKLDSISANDEGFPRMGKVYLVGAGPGHVEYLTVGAQQLLAQAEVLIYDALVDDRLLALVPPNCIQFDVGKRGGRPSPPQTEINRLMVEQCRQGKQVIRLKSGDPFIFGRATSEILALLEAGCPFEVVPGISSALAAPLLAGIPLTDSVLSRCFAVISAHEPDELDWEALARLETLVILMGGRHLAKIVQQLQRCGRSPATPIAIIRDCGRPQQQVWSGTLKNIVKQTAGVSLSPAVMVIGEVVGLRDYLRSPEAEVSREPLDVGTLQVENSEEPLNVGTSQVESSEDSLNVGTLQVENSEDSLDVGALQVESSEDSLNVGTLQVESSEEPLNVTTLQIESPEEPLHVGILQIGSSEESLNVETLQNEASEDLNMKQPQSETSQENLEPTNLEPATLNLEPTNPQPSTQKLAGKTILVTRSAGQSSQFSDLLKQEGAQVIEMPALVITPPSSWDDLDDAIANLSDFDWLILTSSNGVDYFFERLLDQGKDNYALAGVKIAVVGKKTAASLKKHGLMPDFIPPDFVADSLVANFPEPLQGKQVLFPRVESGGRDVLVKEITAQGAQVTEVAAYESGCPTRMTPSALEALQQQRVDVITFASSKTVKHFVQLLETFLPGDSSSFPTAISRLQNVCIASIGPQTTAACRQMLGRVDIEAQEYTLEGLTQAIAQWATGRNRAEMKQIND